MDDNEHPAAEEEKRKEEVILRLLPLFQILTKHPPKDHDFKTCPICKQYGITEI